jgi:hypothetical protein
MVKLPSFIQHDFMSDDGMPPLALDKAYGYVLGSNGVFIRCDSKLIEASVPIEKCEVRDLSAVPEYARLVHGRIPEKYLQDIVSHARLYPNNEVAYQIFWAGDGYYSAVVKVGSKGAISNLRDVSKRVVVQLHSHNTMAAFHSVVDDANQNEFRFYGTIGRVDKYQVEMVLDVGIYGYRVPVSISSVFTAVPLDVYEVKKRD